MYNISCGCLLFNSKNKILILKHKNEFEWDLPKGHQEEGETYMQTTYRELQEEIQFSQNDFTLVENLSEEFTYKSPVSGNMRKIVLFVATTNKEPIISHEHEGYAWCTIEEAVEYLRFKENQETIKNLYEKWHTQKFN